MVSDNDVEFKLSLKAVRVNTKLSQKEMAEKLDVSPCTWFNWENGLTRISAKKLEELSQISNIPQRYIFLQ